MSLDQTNAVRKDRAAGRARTYLVCFLVLALLVSAAGLVLMLTVWTIHSDTVEFEIAKALLQIVVVSVVGTALTLLTSEYQNRRAAVEKDRERERAIAEQTRTELMHTFDKITTGYNGVKRARRLMRALARSANVPEPAIYAKPYDVQMGVVNDLQLEFERVSDRVQASARIFSNPGELRGFIDEMEKYLGALVTEYENARPAFSGYPRRCALARLPQLGAFLGGEFDAFSGPFHRAQENILGDVTATFLSPSGDERGRVRWRRRATSARPI